jgi:uncharacterized protein
MRKWILAVALVLFAQVTSAGYDEGVAAYERGDYATAIKEWRPLAEQGDADAQFLVGNMYDNGEGVPEDDTEAVNWYRKAAEQGNAWAQFYLGFMYSNGQGVPQDYAEAYALFSIAAAAGNKDAAHNRDIAAKKLTPEALQKAQARAKVLWAKWHK